MNVKGRLLVIVGALVAVLLFPAGASAAPKAKPRHVEIIPPSVAGSVDLGKQHGFRISVSFSEPDVAILTVSRFRGARLSTEETKYGAHLRGSLSAGRVRADFGAVGSIDLRFHRQGPARKVELLKECDGKVPLEEMGRWVGKVSLRGEDGYFAVSSGSAPGVIDRVFRLSCPSKHPLPPPEHESLRKQVEPDIGASLISVLVGTVSSLEAVESAGGRVVALRAAHASGSGPGAEVEAGAFEYQGQMPVGRTVQILGSRPGSLVTTLPGEGPATATLKPSAPFRGEADYLATSPAVHSWTGTLAVRFPGLSVPLAGPGFSSTLCVVSTLVKPLGCEYQAPDWQGGEESTSVGRSR
ncbi:MAG: hypothetical protein JST59_12560 [Actinobacteria bacterium]|nr:hypothetical protein [Actinomycetota bacterium]